MKADDENVIDIYDANDPSYDGLPTPRRYWAMAATMLVLFMSVMSINIINVVLPQLALTFEVSNSMVIRLVNIYQLGTIVSLLIFGFLGEKYGYNKVYLTGVMLFAVSSIACALSTTFEILIGSRFLQGIASAAISGVSVAQVRTIYPRRLLSDGLALNAMVVSISMVVGPTIAGAIMSVADWPWLFVLNVPFALVSVLLGVKFLPRVDGNRSLSIDRVGMTLSVVMLAIFFLLFDYMAHGGDWLRSVFGGVIFLVVAIIFVRRELVKSVPLLPIDLLRIPLFRLSVGASICSFMAGMLGMLALPFLLQNHLGYSELETGLLMAPWSIGSIIMAPISGKLVRRLHPGLLGALGMALMAASYAGILLLPESPSLSLLVPVLAGCGGGFALFQTPNNTVLISSAPKERSGGASSMLALARLTGQTIGATLVAMIFHLFAGLSGRDVMVCFAAGILLQTLAALFSVTRLRRKNNTFTS